MVRPGGVPGHREFGQQFGASIPTYGHATKEAAIAEMQPLIDANPTAPIIDATP